jgi:large subunit ribosomal protein L6
MSRIGNKPVQIPGGVKVSVSGQTVKAEGPKGTLSRTFRDEIAIVPSQDGKSLAFSIKGEATRQARALWGTTRALTQNMLLGVSAGYERALIVEGVGWGAEVQGKRLKIQVGYADPVLLDIPAGLTVTAEKQNIKVSGPDKQQVGQFAAMTRKVRKPEPYNGKGVRYANEVIKRKQGKQFGN